MRKAFTALLLATLSAPALAADPELINRLADAEFNRGQVVETAAHLTDRIGGRLTNSPAMREAERWTQAKFNEWGLTNVRADPFEFGRGWWIESSEVAMVAPRPKELRAIPIAWTPATNGTLTAPVIVAPMSDEKHFDAWRGKLAGKIVLVTLPTDPADATEPPFKRLTDAEISARNTYRQPETNPNALEARIERSRFPLALDAFLKSEGALAWGRMSYRDNGLVHGAGYTHKVGQTPSLPAIEIAAEDYRRLARLAKGGPVSLSIDSKVHFEDGDTRAYNIFADIKGSDPSAGYVMAGAHLDSWVAADGAADNAAGSAVIMEAARLISSLGIRPKRTIRFALWSGEEQGLLGSLAYVDKYLAKRPPVTDPRLAAAGPYGQLDNYPITPLPGFKDIVAYFNIDNGGGKLRGIHAEGNFAAMPVLRDWLSPLSSLGASAVVAGPTGGTDHVGLVRLGIPAFQFIQDPLDYGSRVHHTSIDTFDHLRPQDLRQAAVVLASVLLSAANSDKPIPRNVLPSQPNDTNPFRYEDPDDN